MDLLFQARQLLRVVAGVGAGGALALNPVKGAVAVLFVVRRIVVGATHELMLTPLIIGTGRGERQVQLFFTTRMVRYHLGTMSPLRLALPGV